MTSSTREDSSQCPTCMKYMALGAPSVRIRSGPIKPSIYASNNCMAIGEEENGKKVHAINEEHGKIQVLDYEGRNLFRYPAQGVLNEFLPTRICIKNNIVYITDHRNEILFIFTTEGELITRITSYYQNGRTVSVGKLKAVEVDEDNNIYASMFKCVAVFNSTLPLTQKYPSEVVGKPKYIKLFKSEIMILSWENQVNIRILSVEGILLRQLILNEFKVGNRPYYFDITEDGHIIIPNRRLNGINVYSGEKKLITTGALKGVNRPVGIKLLNNKKNILLVCRGDFSFVIF